LGALGVEPRDIQIDLFANHKKPQNGVVLSQRNQCFSVLLVKVGLLAVGKPPLDTASQGHYQALF